MNASDFLAAVNAGEDKDWEFKSAKGGSYQLSDRLAKSKHKEEGTPHTTTANSTHKDADSQHMGEQTPHIEPENDPQLLNLAQLARNKMRISPEEMKTLIEKLCENQFLTPRQIGLLLNRNPAGIQQRFLRPMAQKSELVLRFPEEPNHPNQAYKTKLDEE